MAATNTTIELQAALDKAKSVKNINKDIDKIKGKIKPLELQLKPDSKSLQGFDSLGKELENLGKKMSLDISSQTADRLKEAEDTTDGSLNNLLGIWGAFGAAVEKILSSNNMVSGSNGLVDLISSLHDTAKETLGSLGTVGLGIGLFAGLKNIGKRRASARISNA